MNHMMELGFSKSLADWIGSNLKKSGEHETWAFNLEGAVEMFNSYRYNFNCHWEMKLFSLLLFYMTWNWKLSNEHENPAGRWTIGLC